MFNIFKKYDSRKERNEEILNIEQGMMNIEFKRLLLN